MLVAAALIGAVLIYYTQQVGKPKTTLTVAVLLDPQGLDPWKTPAACTFYITCNIYDTLVRVNPDTWTIEPSIAKSWEVSSDYETWTFHLRDNVYFHNGRKLTADDVVWSFDMIRNPDIHVRASDYDFIERVEAVDNHTVKFVLKEPMGNAFLAKLALPWAAIEPREVVEQYGDLKTHPVGTGPFKFVEWVEGDHVTLERFDKYWELGYPKVDEVIFKVAPEASTRLAGLKAGDFDLVMALDSSHVPEVESTPGLKVIRHPGTIIFATIINNKRPPFNDVRVRQALAYAINKQEILQTVFNGEGEVVGCWMTPSSPCYDKSSEELFPYDPERAKQLLAEAGYPNGFEFIYTLPADYEYHVQVGTVIASQLEKVGIKAKIEMVDWTTWLNRVYNGRDYDVTQIGHTGRIDPSDLLNRFKSYHPKNYMNYSNPEVDKLLEEAEYCLDEQKRNELYRQALRIMAEEVASLPLFIPYKLYGAKECVTGLKPYPIDVLDLKTVEKASETSSSLWAIFAADLGSASDLEEVGRWFLRGIWRRGWVA